MVIMESAKVFFSEAIITDSSVMEDYLKSTYFSQFYVFILS